MTSKNSSIKTSVDDSQLATEFRDNVVTKHRKRFGMKHRNCFTGREAINLIMREGHAETRKQAVEVGNRIMKLGVFSHVRTNKKFKDGYMCYRLAEPIPHPSSQRGIALVAHNDMKDQLLQWAKNNQEPLSHHRLVATGTTGSLISKETGLTIELMKSGPLGGDQQIGAYIAEDKIDTLIFFWDPLTAQPHDADVKALLRLAVLCNVSIAMNLATANGLVTGFRDT